MKQFDFKRIASCLSTSYSAILGIEGKNSVNVTFMVMSNNFDFIWSEETNMKYSDAVKTAVEFCKVFGINRDEELVPQLEVFPELCREIGIGMINISKDV